MMSIGEVAAELGVATSTLRYYESEGLIPIAVRHSGRRVYMRSDIEVIKIVLSGRSVGLSIQQMRTLKPSWIKRSKSRQPMKALLEELLSETDQKIKRLVAQRNALKEALGCECRRAKDCAITSSK